MTRVIFFHAPWCNSCNKFLPTFNKVKEQLSDSTFKMEDMDVEEDEGNDLSCKYQVRNIPTILVIKERVGINEDRVIDRIVGTCTEKELINKLKQWK